MSISRQTFRAHLRDAGLDDDEARRWTADLWRFLAAGAPLTGRPLLRQAQRLPLDCPARAAVGSGRGAFAMCPYALSRAQRPRRYTSGDQAMHLVTRNEDGGLTEWRVFAYEDLVGRSGLEAVYPDLALAARRGGKDVRRALVACWSVTIDALGRYTGYWEATPAAGLYHLDEEKCAKAIQSKDDFYRDQAAVLARYWDTAYTATFGRSHVETWLNTSLHHRVVGADGHPRRTGESPEVRERLMAPTQAVFDAAIAKYRRKALDGLGGCELPTGRD